MRFPAFAESHQRQSDALVDEPGRRREEQIEAMFPDICLPSFVAIPSRRPRPSDTRGLRSKRERASHDR